MPDEAELFDGPFPVLVAGSGRHSGFDLAGPFQLARDRTRTVLIQGLRLQSRVDQRLARYIAVRHGRQRALQALDQVAQVVGVALDLADAFVANRERLQFVIEPGDGEAHFGDAVLPECFIGDDKAETLSQRRHRVEKRFVRGKHHVGLAGRGFLRLIAAVVIVQRTAGFLALADGLLDLRADLDCRLDRGEIAAHRLVGRGVHCIAAAPDRRCDAIRHFALGFVRKPVRWHGDQDAVGQLQAPGFGDEPGDYAPDPFGLADAGGDPDGAVRRLVQWMALDALVPLQRAFGELPEALAQRLSGIVGEGTERGLGLRGPCLVDDDEVRVEHSSAPSAPAARR